VSSSMQYVCAARSTGWVDLLTGDVYDDSATDPMTVGEDAVIDVEDRPDRWLWFDRTGSREGWQDMATITGRQRDPALRERLERAIEGKGAFRRFRDLDSDLTRPPRRAHRTLALRHRPHSANTQATSSNDGEHQAAEAARTAHASALAGGWTAQQLSDAGLRPPKTPRTRKPRPEHTPARGENTPVPGENNHSPAESAAPAVG